MTTWNLTWAWCCKAMRASEVMRSLNAFFVYKLSRGKDDYKFFGTSLMKLLGVYPSPRIRVGSLAALENRLWTKWWCCASLGVQVFKRPGFPFLVSWNIHLWSLESPCKMFSWRDHVKRSWNYTERKRTQLNPTFQQSCPGQVCEWFSFGSLNQLISSTWPKDSKRCCRKKENFTTEPHLDIWPRESWDIIKCFGFSHFGGNLLHSLQ